MNRQDKLQCQMKKIALARKQREKRESKHDSSRTEGSQVKDYVEETLKKGSVGTERSDIQ